MEPLSPQSKSQGPAVWARSRGVTSYPWSQGRWTPQVDQAPDSGLNVLGVSGADHPDRAVPQSGADQQPVGRRLGGMAANVPGQGRGEG